MLLYKTDVLIPKLNRVLINRVKEGFLLRSLLGLSPEDFIVPFSWSKG